MLLSMGMCREGVKANLLLTHFGNFKWTHPDCEKKESNVLCGELATTLICERNGSAKCTI
jgi:hypothetical protein